MKKTFLIDSTAWGISGESLNHDRINSSPSSSLINKGMTQHICWIVPLNHELWLSTFSELCLRTTVIQHIGELSLWAVNCDSAHLMTCVSDPLSVTQHIWYVGEFYKRTLASVRMNMPFISKCIPVPRRLSVNLCYMLRNVFTFLVDWFKPAYSLYFF